MGLFQTIAALGDHLFQFLFQPSGIFKHHVAVDRTGQIKVFFVAVVEFFYMSIHIGPACHQDGYVEDGICLPPAAETKISGHFPAVYSKRKGHRCAHFQIYAQKFGCLCIHHQIIFCLGDRAFCRFAETKPDPGLIHIVEFAAAL